MKFAVGYQFQDENEDPFAQSLCEMADHVDEVYFPWTEANTCRRSLVNNRGQILWTGQQMLEEDLRHLAASGIKLNLLLNANCYGEKSVSRYFENMIDSIVTHILDVAGRLDYVTTTSLFVASCLKRHHPEIKVKASVNMRLGTIQAMKHLADRFDGFYLQRDFNRDLAYIRHIKTYTDAAGKSLHLLANSGCLRFCGGQTFHDNTVAHELEIAETINADNFGCAVCQDYYRQPAGIDWLLANTWIRPEDIGQYEELFPVIKLATRQSQRPLAIIKAYIRRQYNGNLLDLLEPNHTRLLNGDYISNQHFPANWFARTSSCDSDCDSCGYCREVLKLVRRKI